MSPAHVLEPTYQNLKRGLMAGHWRPGERLEALRLAEEFGVSMTPVRDCLNRLVGEGLVDMKPGEGYHVPRLSEKILRDMIDINQQLLEFALSQASGTATLPKADYLVADYAGRVSALFNAIAARSANLVLAEMLSGLSNRMHSIRGWEPQLFPLWAEELGELERNLSGGPKSLASSLRKYHTGRRTRVAELVQLSLS